MPGAGACRLGLPGWPAASPVIVSELTGVQFPNSGKYGSGGKLSAWTRQ